MLSLHVTQPLNVICTHLDICTFAACLLSAHYISLYKLAVEFHQFASIGIHVHTESSGGGRGGQPALLLCHSAVFWKRRVSNRRRRELSMARAFESLMRCTEQQSAYHTTSDHAERFAYLVLGGQSEDAHERGKKRRDSTRKGDEVCSVVGSWLSSPRP